jgi:hypothetical protein
VISTVPAGATTYLTVEEAQRALFPGAARFDAVPLALGDAERRAIRKASPTRTPIPDRVWRVSDDAATLGHLIVDEVYGKHEFITYAVAIDPGGAVLGIEILDYRETHGGEVREAAWRAQFRGKRRSDPLELGEDIVNIGGATLSCKHLTDGVRRVLALHDVALRAHS